jgi:excisionase family DNA binding protein
LPEAQEWHKLSELEAVALQRHLDRIRRVAAIQAARDEEDDNSAEERSCRGRRSGRRAETRQELLSRLLDPTLTLDETARMLDVCPTTVRRYTNRGILPHERSRGNQRRFKLSCVLAFMEAQARVGLASIPFVDNGGKQE